VAAERAALILASASVGRAALLRGAGLEFGQRSAEVDERALEAEAAAKGDLDPGALAVMLAEAKALDVSAREPGALVIGADQVMACGGAVTHKPADVEAARGQLARLRGKTHSLNAGLCVARDGTVLWRHLDRAHLTMRDFSDAFLDAYLRSECEALLRSVGVYRIEGPGIQLFSRIEGDHFTIIGLPLLPLLGYLREIGWLAE
jgi:nucleoside triphosphate pyrophosphatase